MTFRARSRELSVGVTRFAITAKTYSLSPASTYPAKVTEVLIQPVFALTNPFATAADS